MKDKDILRSKAVRDLGLDIPFTPNCPKPVHNCWHYSTDGSYSSSLFLDRTDFIDAMNRLARCYLAFQVLILAFCLMDNHVHFVLYGISEECTAFVKEFMRRTGQSISKRHGFRKSIYKIPISHEQIKDDNYLKNAICYDIANPPVNGLRYTYYDYPWSSGPLYFRSENEWSSPSWMNHPKAKRVKDLSSRELIGIDTHQTSLPKEWIVIDGLIFPGHYVASDIAERLFGSFKAYNYLAGRRNETAFDSSGGRFCGISLPDNELRQYRDELCVKMFGCSPRKLNARQRIELGRALKSQFGSSTKQIARMVCLSHDELLKGL